ncbi:MAG: GNAT family N-acetyltransferase [Pseudohongiellaceae bacterium]|nr:GNAT family N-acetyltransferase [Pseudohongiellaceae bacterium]
MNIEYRINESITPSQFIELLEKTALGERRPIDDRALVEGMLANSNLIVSAWHDNELVGVARSVTDFHYCCYLSDLAVSESYQRAGIGKHLLSLSQEQLGPKCKLLLFAAPDANDYYANIGFEHNPRGWTLERGVSVE